MEPQKIQDLPCIYLQDLPCIYLAGQVLSLFWTGKCEPFCDGGCHKCEAIKPGSCGGLSDCFQEQAVWLEKSPQAFFSANSQEEKDQKDSAARQFSMQRSLKLSQVDLELPLAFQPLEWWAGLSKGKKGKRGKREK